jgi:hypothetical protein
MAPPSKSEKNENDPSKATERISVKRGAIPSPKADLEGATPYVPAEDENPPKSEQPDIDQE